MSQEHSHNPYQQKDQGRDIHYANQDWLELQRDAGHDDFEMPPQLDGQSAATVSPLELHQILDVLPEEQRKKIINELVKREIEDASKGY